MTYEEALERIHDRERFGRKLTLDRIKELLKRLGDPQKGLKIIHVAGTNGKGSVTKMIYSCLLEAGCRAGAYTSPYLIDFRERIEFGGEMIPKDDLARITEAVLEKVEEMEAEGLESPTEFEVVMAVAFEFYRQAGAEYVVLEVGMGGRGDATNVIDAPLASVITSISFDHTDYLGDTLAKIAFEKAGIIKPGCPVIYNVSDESARNVIEARAAELGCRTYPAGSCGKIYAKKSRGQLEGLSFRAEILGKNLPGLYLPLSGVYQKTNVLTALVCLEVLRQSGSVAMSDEDIKAGLARVRHIGRMEVLQRDPLVLIDGAHNVEGITAFTQSVRDITSSKKSLLILGILKDKEYREMIRLCCGLDCDLAFAEPENSRKASTEDLAAAAGDCGKSGAVLGDAASAVAYAKEKLGEYECVLFAGSLYFVGAVKSMWEGNERG